MTVRVLTALSITALIALGVAMPLSYDAHTGKIVVKAALAKHGADDPPGDDRGGPEPQPNDDRGGRH